MEIDRWRKGGVPLALGPVNILNEWPPTLNPKIRKFVGLARIHSDMGYRIGPIASDIQKNHIEKRVENS